MKILYAAANFNSSRLQLFRFLEAIGDKHQVKVAAYKKSSPKGIRIDWTLDSILHMFSPEFLIIKDNENLDIYAKQIKAYNPDLIISDFEYYTSEIARVYNYKLWQCSPIIMKYGLAKEAINKIGFYKYYESIFMKHRLSYELNVHALNVLQTADKKFIYSHYGDAKNTFSLKNDYDWIRPYFKLGEESIPCRHNMIAAVLNNEKKVINELKHYRDSVLFTENIENYNNILVKSILNQEEYYCNLFNSNGLISEGQTCFLADAFYNIECVINKCIMDNWFKGKQLEWALNPRIKFLHEKIEDEC